MREPRLLAADGGFPLRAEYVNRCGVSFRAVPETLRIDVVLRALSETSAL